MTPEILRELVRAAIASPSVHNVQPARWLIEGDTLILLEDPSRRLAVGDPSGNDAALSLGAAAEGLRLAASSAGFAVVEDRLTGKHGSFVKIARLSFTQGSPIDPLAHFVSRRASWRGPFNQPRAEDIERLAALSGEDRLVISDKAAMDRIARLYDAASYVFMRHTPFRKELRHWMRLRRSHPKWSQDGLNAAAMNMSPIEAWGAGAVLGPLFKMLATVRLAPRLLSERASFGQACGVILFHRPKDEDPYESGKYFHRAWLTIESAGFGANVLAAMADDAPTSAILQQEFALPDKRKLVSAFRFGKRPAVHDGFERARLRLDEVLID